MAGGRPREYDYAQEGRELEAWAQLDTSLNLYGFTKNKPYLASQMCEFAHASEEFSQSLKKAKELIALRREEKLNEGKLHIAAWGRSARMYDGLLKKQEDQDKDDDAARKAKIVAATPVNPYMQKISEIQSKPEDLVGRSAE
jgi:hypothetical protein